MVIGIDSIQMIMKRFLAYFVLPLMLLAMLAGYAIGVDENVQEPLNSYTAVCCPDCEEMFQNPVHAIAYAENGTFTQLVTGTNYSPRSSFPTLTITRNIPSPSFEGHHLHAFKHPVIGRILPVHARLYVLRV